MFHITVIGAERAERGMTRLSAARFAVHCFAGNTGVNSALYCWTLAAECARLWKSRCARRNTLFTAARRACAITSSNCQGISFSAARLLVASAVDGFGFSLFGFSRARIATLANSVVTCLMKMQLSHMHLHVATAAARWRLGNRQHALRRATGYLGKCRALAQHTCRVSRLLCLANDPDPENFEKRHF
jgi:hypothetical protein